MHKLKSLGYELSEPFNNFQGSMLIFPTTGCWEITGHAGNASLTFVTEVLFDAGAATPTPITTPNMVTIGTPTAVIEQGGYDWRQTKLYLNAPLPELPAQANISWLKGGSTSDGGYGSGARQSIWRAGTGLPGEWKNVRIRPVTL